MGYPYLAQHLQGLAQNVLQVLSRNLLRKFARSVVFTLTLASFPVYAGFVVVEEQRPPCTYNGESAVYHRAITGAGPLTPREQEELAIILPINPVNRYYGRVRVNFDTLILDQIKNRTSDTQGAVNIKRTSRNQVGLELAVGYAWSLNFRGDIEYLANRDLNYNANPALSGNVPFRTLSAVVKNNTLLFNIYYDFNGIYRFQPYVTAGVGPSLNSVTATVNPAPGTTLTASQNLRTIRCAYQLGAGIRVGLFSRWFLDVSYRYIRLGNGIGITPVAGYKLLSSLSMNAASVGINYIF